MSYISSSYYNDIVDNAVKNLYNDSGLDASVVNRDYKLYKIAQLYKDLQPVSEHFNNIIIESPLDIAGDDVCMWIDPSNPSFISIFPNTNDIINDVLGIAIYDKSPYQNNYSVIVNGTGLTYDYNKKMIKHEGGLIKSAFVKTGLTSKNLNQFTTNNSPFSYFCVIEQSEIDFSTNNLRGIFSMGTHTVNNRPSFIVFNNNTKGSGWGSADVNGIYQNTTVAHPYLPNSNAYPFVNKKRVILGWVYGVVNGQPYKDLYYNGIFCSRSINITGTGYRNDTINFGSYDIDGFYFEGWSGEQIIISRDLTRSEVIKMCDYLNNKWNCYPVRNCDVFVCAGESNMIGRGNPAGGGPAFTDIQIRGTEYGYYCDPQIYYTTSESPISCHHGVNGGEIKFFKTNNNTTTADSVLVAAASSNDNATKTDCLAEFGNEYYKKTGRYAVFCKAAVSGSSLLDDDDWLPSNYKNNLWLNVMNIKSNIIEKLTINGWNVGTCNLIWHQGESDTGSDQVEYLNTLNEAFEMVINYFKYDRVFYYIVSAAGDSRNAQLEYTPSNSNIYSIFDTNVFISTRLNFLNINDTTHYNTSGQEMMGIEGGKVVGDIINKNSNLTIKNIINVNSVNVNSVNVNDLILDERTTSNPPSIYFQDVDETRYNTGINMYRDSANANNQTISFYTNNTKKMDISENRIICKEEIRGIDGSINVPTFSFESDTDTGFYRKGVNNLCLVSGGIDKIDIKPSATDFKQTSNFQVSSSITDLSASIINPLTAGNIANSQNWTSLAFDGTRYRACCPANGSFNPNFAQSIDGGETWTLFNSSTSWGNPNFIIWFSSRWYAFTSVPFGTYLSNTTTGTTSGWSYTNYTGAPVGNINVTLAKVVNNQLLVVTNTGLLRSTTDGTNWIQQTAAIATNKSIVDIAYNSVRTNLYVGVANNGGIYYATGTSIVTGTTWTSVASLSAINFRSVIYSPKLDLFVAFQLDSPYSIYASRDGINWDTSITLEPIGIFTPAYGIWIDDYDGFFIVGQNGANQMLISRDGMTWNIHTPNINVRPSSFHYNSSTTRLTMVGEHASGINISAFSVFSTNAPTTNFTKNVVNIDSLIDYSHQNLINGFYSISAITASVINCDTTNGNVQLMLQGTSFNNKIGTRFKIRKSTTSANNVQISTTETTRIIGPTGEISSFNPTSTVINIIPANYFGSFDLVRVADTSNGTWMIDDIMVVDTNGVELKLGSLSANVFRAGDGSISIPSYSFNTDSDTGMYMEISGNRRLRFSVDGVDRLVLSGSGTSSIVGRLSLDFGSVSAPSLFLSDTGTGFYRSGLNQLGITTNGVLNTNFTTSGIDVGATGAGNNRNLLVNGYIASQTDTITGNVTFTDLIYDNYIIDTSGGNRTISLGTANVNLYPLGRTIRFYKSSSSNSITFASLGSTRLITELGVQVQSNDNFTNIPTNSNRFWLFEIIRLNSTTYSIKNLWMSDNAYTFTQSFSDRSSSDFIQLQRDGYGAYNSTNPSLYFENDTNTGIYSTASDTINFSTNATQRLRIDNTGVSITAPFKPTNLIQYSVSTQFTANFNINTTGSHFIRVSTSNNDVTITLSNVGAGTHFTIFKETTNNAILITNNSGDTYNGSTRTSFQVIANGNMGIISLYQITASSWYGAVNQFS